MGDTAGGTGDTAGMILDSAERIVPSRGLGGFSYAHVAAELQITKASLHVERFEAAAGRLLTSLAGVSELSRLETA